MLGQARALTYEIISTGCRALRREARKGGETNERSESRESKRQSREGP